MSGSQVVDFYIEVATPLQRRPERTSEPKSWRIFYTSTAACEAQIERYRAMTKWERVAIALRLHEMACELARLGIRRQHPNATGAQVEALLRERLALAWKS